MLKNVVRYLGGYAAVTGLSSPTMAHGRKMLQSANQGNIHTTTAGNLPTPAQSAIPSDYVYATEPAGPGELFHNSQTAQLSISDPTQGHLGDCYLGAAYTALVESNLGQKIVSVFALNANKQPERVNDLRHP